MARRLKEDQEVIHDIASLPGFKTLPKEERDHLVEIMKRQLLVERRKLELLSADRCANNLEQFVKEAWPVMYGRRPLSWNWHLSVGCEMLQAMKMGQIHRLLMCWPPRTLKSNLVSVFYPPFVWTSQPNHQFITLSHRGGIAERDAGRSRRMMQMEWYLKRWGDEFYFTADQNEKKRYVNSEGGHRISQGIMSGVIGEDADCLVGETIVETDQGQMTISDLHALSKKPKVLAVDHGEDEIDMCRVLATKVMPARRILTIHTCEGKKIRCTPRHRFFTKYHGYEIADHLQRGERLMVVSDGPLRERSWDTVCLVDQCTTDLVDVYDIQVEGAANFFANSILVHNSVIVDDPSDPKKLMNEKQREKINDEIWPDIQLRLNDQMTGNIIVMLQRIHEGDLAGHVIDTDTRQEFVRVIFPLEFEEDHPTPCKYDIRKREGELLDGKRFPRAYIDALKERTNAYIYSGRFQQRPSLRGGNILMRDWWNIWVETDLPSVEIIIISLDTAFEEGQENDYTACTIWGLWKPNPKAKKYSMILMHAWRERARYGIMKAKAIATIQKWTVDDQAPDHVIVEKKASGQSLLQDFADGGIEAFGYNPGRESLTYRANIMSDILEDGNIWVPGRLLQDGKRSDRILASWAEPVVLECERFPKAEHDDYVTTVIQAFHFAADCGYLESSLDLPMIDYTPPTSSGSGNSDPIYG